MLSRSAAVGFASRTSWRTTGMMLSASWSFMSSSSRTKPFVAIAGSEVNSSPTSMWPPVRAWTVSGPPASSGTNSANSRPYVSVNPRRQNGRSGHSGGPPSLRVVESAGPAGADGDSAGADGDSAAGSLGALVSGGALAAEGDGLLPPDEHAPTSSASNVAPRATVRNVRMGPPLARLRDDLGHGPSGRPGV